MDFRKALIKGQIKTGRGSNGDIDQVARPVKHVTLIAISHRLHQLSEFFGDQVCAQKARVMSLTVRLKSNVSELADVLGDSVQDSNRQG